jgi:16S rRNA (guanine527-N7)-methyltransferase
MADRQRDFSAPKDRALLLELASAFEARLPDATLDALGRYVELVVTWNKKLDLTAARGVRAQLEVLLADSLLLARDEIVPRGARCVDVGSGAGAPALPLLMVRPDLHAILVEPRRKRVAFLRSALGSLGLSARAQVSESKVEPDPQPSAAELPGAPFDVALSRATFAPAQWLPVALRLAPRGLVLLAGQAPPRSAAGAQLVATHAYALPWSRAPRAIAVYQRD